MIEYKSYARVFITTFQVSVLTTLICILIGYPLSYFLALLPARWVGFFMLAVLLPFWTSLLVRTYAWLVLLQKKGLLNDFAIQIGLWDSPIKLVHNMTGTLIGMAHIMLPFLVLPLYNAMKKIDRDLMYAAANLGASPVKAFWQVYFPLSLPGMVAGSLIVFVLCLGFLCNTCGSRRRTGDNGGDPNYCNPRKPVRLGRRKRARRCSTHCNRGDFVCCRPVIQVRCRPVREGLR